MTFCLTHVAFPPIIPIINPCRYDPQICGSKECPYVNLCLAQAAGFTDAQCNPPPPCTLDVKVCPTGEVYRRSPLLDCNFPPCPGQTCPLGELECAFVLLIIHPLIKLTCITQHVSFSCSHNRIVLTLIYCSFRCFKVSKWRVCQSQP